MPCQHVARLDTAPSSDHTKFSQCSSVYRFKYLESWIVQDWEMLVGKELCLLLLVQDGTRRHRRLLAGLSQELLQLRLACSPVCRLAWYAFHSLSFAMSVDQPKSKHSGSTHATPIALASILRHTSWSSVFVGCILLTLKDVAGCSNAVWISLVVWSFMPVMIGRCLKLSTRSICVHCLHCGDPIEST